MNYLRNMIRFVLILIFSMLLGSCARKGSPSGGPRDFTPPKFLKANPDTFALQVSTHLKEIKLDFDEYIVLKDAQKQIVVSPPMERPPIFYPSSSKPRKYILIKLQDSLQKQTTYSFNFGESIADNNEGNTLDFFQFVFSTGAQIDSLNMKGIVDQSLDKKVIPETLLALYKQDSLPVDLSQKPYYITKIDSTGSFEFDHLHEGSFRLIAFTDYNGNLRHDSEELIAFHDSLVDPIQNKNYHLTLSENKATFQILSVEQKNMGEILIRTAGKPKNVNIHTIGENFASDFKISHKAYSDSTFIYFNAKGLNFTENKERIAFIFDSNNNRKDTISLLYNSKVEAQPRLQLAQQKYTPEKKVVLESNLALRAVQSEYIKVYQDSIEKEFQVHIDSLYPKKLILDFPIEFDQNYNIQLLPKAVQDFSLNTQDSLQFSFKTLKSNDFGNLTLTITNPPEYPFFLQLLSNDKVVQNIYGSQSEFSFRFLEPKEYTFRILVDENANGIWDGSDFENNQQAEKTYLYSKKILIRAFWDLNEIWNL